MEIESFLCNNIPLFKRNYVSFLQQLIQLRLLQVWEPLCDELIS